MEIEVELKLRSVLVAILSLASGFALGYLIGSGRARGAVDQAGRGWDRLPAPAERTGAW